MEKALAKVLVLNTRGYLETWRFLYDAHFLGLVGFEAARFVGSEAVSAVLAFPEEDAPLAVAVSEWLGCKTCICTTNARLSASGYLYSCYESPDRGFVVSVYMPRGALKRGDTVLIVKSVVKDWSSLRAIANLVENAKGRIWGALAVAAISTAWAGIAEKYGVKKVRVLRRLGP